MMMILMTSIMLRADHKMARVWMTVMITFKYCKSQLYLVVLTPKSLFYLVL
jgi:hypothetical protein